MRTVKVALCCALMSVACGDGDTDTDTDTGQGQGSGNGGSALSQAIRNYCAASCQFLASCFGSEPPGCQDGCNTSVAPPNLVADETRCAAAVNAVASCTAQADCTDPSSCDDLQIEFEDACQRSSSGGGSSESVTLGADPVVLSGTTPITYEITTGADSVFVETASNMAADACDGGLDLVLLVPGLGTIDNDNNFGNCESTTLSPEVSVELTVESINSNEAVNFFIRLTPQ